jgi:uncharacterized membrane protein
MTNLARQNQVIREKQERQMKEAKRSLMLTYGFAAAIVVALVIAGLSQIHQQPYCLDQGQPIDCSLLPE